MADPTVRAAVESALPSWLRDAQAVVDGHLRASFPSLPRRMLSVERGLRYAKVVVDDGHGHRSVWAFVDTATGDVLKPEGWAKPAAHARGNLLGGPVLDRATGELVADRSLGRACLGPYGPNYLTDAQCAALRRGRRAA